MTVALRDATRRDVPTLLNLIARLAAYERREGEAVATEALLERHLFGPRPRAEAMLAEQAGAAVGMALWFYAFSTFRGRPTLYIEDVFVDEAARGQGIGRAIFAELARRALAADCARMEWSVLDWNAQAIGFYRALGAVPMTGWTVQRLDGDALARLAGEHDG